MDRNKTIIKENEDKKMNTPFLKNFKTWFLSKVMLPLAAKDDVESLKSFAVSMSLALPFIFMLILPYLFSQDFVSNIPVWPIFISTALIFLYFVKPSLLYLPYVMWMCIASILGYVNTRLILAIAYYLLIVPIGLFMRVKKGLQYKTYKGEPSAWVKRETSPQKHNLKEPF